MKREKRTFEQIREHYELERSLATQLRTAKREERQFLYTALYDKLFTEIPHHPQLTRKADPIASRQEVARKMRLLLPYLKPDTTFLEVGPGDCQLSFAVAEQVQQVYGVDISNEITHHVTCPDNFQLILCDGCNIPLSEAVVDVAYSNQLMEHLHPEDAIAQLQDLYRLLKPGGTYLCITPNRWYGPGDISQYFDREATGFHLKEYTHQELACLIKQVGFSRLRTYAGGRGYYLPCPQGIIAWVEGLMARLPVAWRRPVGQFWPIKAILGIIVIAEK